MAKKRKTISVILSDGSKLNLSEDEILIIKNITKAGSCTYSFIREVVGEKRLRKLCNSGILKKEKPYRIELDGKIVNRHCYGLGDTGGKFALEQGFCSQLQGHNGYVHAEKMQKVVKELIVDKGIDIKDIYNEKEQKIIFKDKISKAKRDKVDFRVNDLAYKNSDNNWESVEITTKNYGKKLKKKHSNYAKVINANYTDI